MAMATRLQATKRRDKNIEIIKNENKLVAKKNEIFETQARKAFGDIHNKQNLNTLKQNGLDKDRSKGAPFKDVKPRVDTRWKKTEPTDKNPKVSLASIKPLTRNVSKPEIVQKNYATNTNSNLVKGKTSGSLPSLFYTSRTKDCCAVDNDKIQNSNDSESKLKSLGLKGKSFKPNIQQDVKLESHSSRMIDVIENIDEKDIGNPQLVSVYVNDIYSYLFRLENEYPIMENYMSSQVDITPKMRSVLLDWINEVHRQFSLEIETYYTAVSLIDRYLQTVHTTTRKNLQLVGITALFIASKYEELTPPDISDFVYVTDDTYSKLQIFQMEKNILKSLNFELCKPLPIHFLRRFAKAAGTSDGRQYVLAKYLLELISVDYNATKYKPSEAAAAALYLSLFLMNKLKSNNDLWTPTLQYYSRYKKEDLISIIKNMAVMAVNAKDAKQKSVYIKYSHSNYKFISRVPELGGKNIMSLISDLENGEKQYIG